VSVCVCVCVCVVKEERRGEEAEEPCSNKHTMTREAKGVRIARLCGRTSWWC